MIRIGRFPFQAMLGAQLSLGTQPRYKTSSVLWVEIDKSAVINTRLVRLSTWEWPKVDRGGGSQIVVEKMVSRDKHLRDVLIYI